MLDCTLIYNTVSDTDDKYNDDKSDANGNVESVVQDTEETTKTKISLNCSVCDIKRKISRVYAMCQQWVCGTCIEEFTTSDIGQRVTPGKGKVCLDVESKPDAGSGVADSSDCLLNKYLVVKIERISTNDHGELKITDDSAVACVKDIVQKNVEKLKDKCVYLDNIINSLKLKVRYIDKRKYEIFGEIRRKIDMSISVIDQCVQSLNFLQSECVAKTEQLSLKQKEIDPFVVKLKKCIESTELILKSWNDNTQIQLMKQKDISQLNHFLETEIVIDSRLFDFSVEYKNASSWCANSLEIGVITINNKSYPHLRKSVAKTSEGSQTGPARELPLNSCENSTCSACNLRLFIDDSPRAVDEGDNTPMFVDEVHNSIVSVEETHNLEMPRKSQNPCSVNQKVHGDGENTLNKTLDLILRQALSSAKGSADYAKKKPETSESDMATDRIPSDSHEHQKKKHAETILTSANVSAKAAEKIMGRIQSDMTSDCILLDPYSENDNIQNIRSNSESVHTNDHAPVNTAQAATAGSSVYGIPQNVMSDCPRVHNETRYKKSQFETALRPANTNAQNAHLNNTQAVPVQQSSKCSDWPNSEQSEQQLKANKQPIGNKQPKTNKQPNANKQPTTNKGPKKQPKTDKEPETQSTTNKGPKTQPTANKGSRPIRPKPSKEPTTSTLERGTNLEPGGAGSQEIPSVAMSLSQPFINTGFPRLIGDHNRVPYGNLPANFQPHMNGSFNARYVFNQNCRLPYVSVHPYSNNYRAPNIPVMGHRIQNESIIPFTSHGVNPRYTGVHCGRQHVETVNPCQMNKKAGLNVSQRYGEQTRMVTADKGFCDFRHNETISSNASLYLNKGANYTVGSIQNSNQHSESIDTSLNSTRNNEVNSVEPEMNLFQSDHEAIQALYCADKSKDLDRQAAQNSTEHLTKDRNQEPPLSNEVLMYSRATDSYLNVSDNALNARSDDLQLISPDIISSSVVPLMSPVGPLMSPVETNSGQPGPMYTGGSAIRELSKMGQRITGPRSNSVVTETSQLYRKFGGLQEQSATHITDRDSSISYSLDQLNTAYGALQASFIRTQRQPMQPHTPIVTFLPQMTARPWFPQDHRKVGMRSQAECGSEMKTGGIDDQIVEKTAGKCQ